MTRSPNGLRLVKSTHGALRLIVGLVVLGVVSTVAAFNTFATKDELDAAEIHQTEWRGDFSRRVQWQTETLYDIAKAIGLSPKPPPQ